MQNEQEITQEEINREMDLAKKMAHCAIKKTPFDNVLLDCPPNLKQSMYAIAIGACAQMNEKEAINRIGDACPSNLKQAIFSEAMEIFAKEGYDDIFKRIWDTCPNNLKQAIFSEEMTKYAINGTESSIITEKTEVPSDLIKNIFARTMVDCAENKIALNRTMNICPSNLKEKALTLAINICRQPDYRKALSTLTLELNMVKFNQFMKISENDKKRKRDNTPSTENESEKKPSSSRKIN